ncbi:hypothetical protein V6N12_006630 [Hibiscus sabdariffa]|uniref:CCHC-type domain-containing protein n=1 Tax=Hibiscus sabdariffa TaxID=183260 RepID=A0ABR2EZE8_9ROSI
MDQGQGRTEESRGRVENFANNVSSADTGPKPPLLPDPHFTISSSKTTIISGCSLLSPDLTFSPLTNFVFHLRTTVELRPVTSGWSSSSLCVGRDSRSRSRSRSRSPMDRKIRSDRFSYRNAPYRRESRRGFSQNNLCKNCKRPGHYARECPNVAICHNCNLPGHIASECTTKSLCWNCREPGHTANHCPNEGICHTCGKSGHRARDCTAPPMPPGDVRLCNNCYKPGHIAADCTNDKACNNCRRPGHLARDCTNDPICNLCNVAGHMARQCPKSNMIGDRSGGGGGRGGYRDHRDIVCRNCHQFGHMSRDCMGPLMICHNCGGRGHMAYECPSGRYLDRYPRRY